MGQRKRYYKIEVKPGEYTPEQVADNHYLRNVTAKDCMVYGVVFEDEAEEDSLNAALDGDTQVQTYDYRDWPWLGVGSRSQGTPCRVQPSVSEAAMLAGMEGGCDAFNEAMGCSLEVPEGEDPERYRPPQPHRTLPDLGKLTEDDLHEIWLGEG